MGTLAADEGRQRTRRTKLKSKDLVPKWETTRAFTEPKSLPKALPTITEDGAVCHDPSNRPKFVVQVNSTEKSEVQGQELETRKETHREENKKRRKSQGANEANNASFKAMRKRQRRELEKYAEKLEDFEVIKANVADMATKIVANPEENVSLLKELRHFAHQYRGTGAALVVLTEAQLYKDIAPAYKIRAISEKEAETKVSKDVARLRNFEEAFLASYQRFVRSCISVSQWHSGGAKETAATKNMKIVRTAACKALGELVSSLSHFNDANIIATAVCRLVMDREDEVRLHSTKSLKEVLDGAHRASGQALETCVLIGKTLASLATGKKGTAREEVLEPLVCIQFSNFPMLPISSKEKNEPRKSKRFIKKRRRNGKQGTDTMDAELERDMREAEAEATPQELYSARKSLLDAACHAYFNIIKEAVDSRNPGSADDARRKRRTRKPPPALSAALKGLLRVSIFVSTDILEAILAALNALLSEGGVPLGIQFRCLSAAYSILAKNSASAKMDPNSFVGDVRALDSALYAALGKLYGVDAPTKDEEYITFDAAETILAAVAHNRRVIPPARCASLARRLSIMAGSAAPNHTCTIGLLLASQKLTAPSLVSPIYAQNTSDKGFFGEVGTVQAFDFNTDDPDVANAERSASWELSCLACHFHPTIREMAEEIATGKCGFQCVSSKESILKQAKEHKSGEGGFNPAPRAFFGNQKRGKFFRKHSLWKDSILIETLPELRDRKSFLLKDSQGLPEAFSR